MEKDFRHSIPYYFYDYKTYYANGIYSLGWMAGFAYEYVSKADANPAQDEAHLNVVNEI